MFAPASGHLSAQTVVESSKWLNISLCMANMHVIFLLVYHELTRKTILVVSLHTVSNQCPWPNLPARRLVHFKEEETRYIIILQLTFLIKINGSCRIMETLVTNLGLGFTLSDNSYMQNQFEGTLLLS